MPSTTSVLSTYTTFAASAMLIKTVINEVQSITSQLIPQQIQEKILSGLGGLFGNHASQMTLVIDEYNGYAVNQMYEASEIYLSTKITPSVEKLKVSKAPQDKDLTVTVNKGETIIDTFEGIALKWEMISTESKQSSESGKFEHRSIELSFHKKYMEKVFSFYLPHVIERAQTTKEQNKAVKLYSVGNIYGGKDGGAWESTNLDHPSTFDTLAMDPTLKKELIDDLDRFLKRRDFYRKVGKAWKRGYLLYGPPGTGKSSLIAAMANYLKFNIYDLELTSLHCNADLRSLLVASTNRSILVIEDIDCSIELQDRQDGENKPGDNKLTLSGLLNFIDGLWSSCGNERIIVFTTNHKEKLDPALLRPGRMDMHIHMSYCTPSGFKILASNYLGISTHCLFTEIEKLITEVDVTPAEVAEELLKSESADVALGRLIEFLQRKKIELSKSDTVGGSEVSEQEKESAEVVEIERIVGNKRKARKAENHDTVGGENKPGNKKAKRGKGRKRSLKNI